MGSTSVLLAIAAFALLAHQMASAGQPDLPWWARAGLTQDDVGPGFEITRSEFFSQDGFASYLVQFERSATVSSGGMRTVGSLLIQNERSPHEPEFDELASAIVRQRPGLQSVEGPSVGNDARWYAGPWGDVAGEDEAYVLVARLGPTVVSIAVAGDPGNVRQAEALSFATVVVERLASLAPSPTPTASATPEGAATPEPLGPQLTLPFAPTPTPSLLQGSPPAPSPDTRPSPTGRSRLP